MDAFESIAAKILELDGYWVRQSVKIENLNPDQKEYMNNRYIPTPEIDLVAFKDKTCVLFEVKSFLDSNGVTMSAIKNPKTKEGKKYAIINNRRFQKLISQKIRESFKLGKNIKIKYGLIAGKIAERDYKEIQNHFKANGYELYTPSRIVSNVISLGSGVYVNDEVTMTVKQLRNAGHLLFNKQSIEDLIKDLEKIQKVLVNATKQLKKLSKDTSLVENLRTESAQLKERIGKLKKDLKNIKNKGKKEKINLTTKFH